MNTSKKEPRKQAIILIKRNAKKTKNELSLSYDTTPIVNSIENEEEKANLLKLVKNILLCCNFSYFNYLNNKMFGFFKSLFFSNFFYFFGLRFLFKFLYKNKKNEQRPEKEAAFWQKFLLFNLPQLFLIFLYYKKKLEKINKSIFLLFSYLNERISYLFNNDKKNNYLCKIDQHNYNINLIKKEESNNESGKKLYINNEEYLSKETFFDSVVSYSNAEFGDFDFDNLDKKEEEMFQDIFELINGIEKKIKDDNYILRIVANIAGKIALNHAVNFNILKSLGLKLVAFLIDEIYLNNYSCKKQREKLIEEKTKEFNEKNMENGYFLCLNEHVILLFRIKNNFKSFDESYSILYTDSQNLLKRYFK